MARHNIAFLTGFVASIGNSKACIFNVSLKYFIRFPPYGFMPDKKEFISISGTFK